MIIETTHLAAFGNMTYTTGLWEIGFGLEFFVPAEVTESGLEKSIEVIIYL